MCRRREKQGIRHHAREGKPDREQDVCLELVHEVLDVVSASEGYDPLEIEFEIWLALGRRCKGHIRTVMARRCHNHPRGCGHRPSPSICRYLASLGRVIDAWRNLEPFTRLASWWLRAIDYPPGRFVPCLARSRIQSHRMHLTRLLPI